MFNWCKDTIIIQDLLLFGVKKCSLRQSTKQIASLLSIHIYQKLFRNMLNHMQHFVTEAIHVFSL